MQIAVGRCQSRFILLMLVGVQGAPLLLSQATQNTAAAQGSTALVGSRWDNVANRWQHTPVDLATQTDTVSPAVRAQRNAYWLNPSINNMIMQQVLSGAQSSTPLTGNEPELPVAKDSSMLNSVWAIATFESFHVYPLDSNEKLLYTELNLRIDSVIREPENMHLAPGSLIDVERLGGMAKTHAGAIVTSRNLSPAKYDFQPGHKYLLYLLSHEDDGGFFTAYKRWDVTSGVVQPDSQFEVDRAARGESKLVGMTVGNVIKYLQATLPG